MTTKPSLTVIADDPGTMSCQSLGRSVNLDRVSRRVVPVIQELCVTEVSSLRIADLVRLP